jgi:eukaryotic-like serine/threonine-protein kinase
MSGIPAGAGQLLGKRLGKFEILALLALGGTAEIYLARIGGAAGFEKYVVVKCLHDHLADDPEFVKMFLDEARLAAHLDHSNIVQTMELGQHDGRYYMVMEFLAGLSLAMIVRRATERLTSARIPVPLVLNILAQACAGLHYAHEKAMNGKALKIVHRDISPQNLVISFEGVVKVVDFGIAKAELRETHTRSGTIKGKFAYMSPEQCVANDVDRRTDVFALGVIGHELLTGRRLFKRPSPYETYQAVMECDVKPPSTLVGGIDAALDQVVMRAVSKDKADRYPTAEAFGDALLGYLHHRGIGSGPGDVSRFFDAQFTQEIDEHSGRMRELISGREIRVETGVTWGADDGDDEGRREAAARLASEGDPPRPVDAGEGPPLASLGMDSLAMALDGLGGGSRVEADDEMPAERTRIESNPLERINELDRVVARDQASAGPQRLPPSGALALPDPPPRPSGMPASGRFPDLANLPTMIAGAEPVAADDIGDAPTLGTMPADPALGPPRTPPSGQPQVPTAFAHQQTSIVPPPSTPPGHGWAQAALATAFPHQPTSIAPLGMSPPGSAPSAHGGPQPDPMALGYPVLNAQLSEQITTGATVFPSEPQGSQQLMPGGPHPGARGSDPGRPVDGLGSAGAVGDGGRQRAEGYPPRPHGPPGAQGSYGGPGPYAGPGGPGPYAGPGSQGGPGGPGSQGGPGGPGPYAGPGPYGGPGSQGGPGGSGSQGGPGGLGPYGGPGSQGGPGGLGPYGGPGSQGGPGGPGPYGGSQGGPGGPGSQGGPGGPGPYGGSQGRPGGPGSQGGPGGPGSQGGPGGPGSQGGPGGLGPYGGPGRQGAAGSNGIDAADAASLMSPVGQDYPAQVDWGAAASAPTRVVPPWLLTILFIAAIGIALGLTIGAARLFH